MFKQVVLWLLVSCSVVFLIIGITALSLGCNVHLDGQCSAYYKIEGIAYETYIKTRVKKNDKEYQTLVKYHYHDNATCIYTAEKHNTVSGSQKSLQRYPVGDKKNFIVRKGLSICMKISEGHDIWIVGLVFIIFAVLLLRELLQYKTSFRSEQTVAVDQIDEENNYTMGVVEVPTFVAVDGLQSTGDGNDSCDRNRIFNRMDDFDTTITPPRATAVEQISNTTLRTVNIGQIV